AFVGKGNGDDENFDRLNDGWKRAAEAPPKYTALLAGSARTHRIKFDLGAVKEVSSIDLYMKDNYRDVYNGNHASNRGYNKDDGFAVYSDAAGKNAVAFTLSEVNQKDDEGEDVATFYIVTLKLKKKVTTQYITIDIQAELAGKHPECEDDLYTPGAYVVSINEVEIFGGDASSATPTETTEKAEDPTQGTQQQGATETQKPATTKDSGTVETGDSTSIAFIAIIAAISLAGAAIVLKKKKTF
ncbi:MAG: LPXTG cell wall anchor domain-containing protein, partial [Clostridia bacterium]|nr:LPXTG cell wall anchor domain-containing protein [Clostridia bacterium]